MKKKETRCDHVSFFLRWTNFHGITSFPIAGSIFCVSISEVPCHRTKQKPTQGQSFLCSHSPGIPTQLGDLELSQLAASIMPSNGMT